MPYHLRTAVLASVFILLFLSACSNRAGSDIITVHDPNFDGPLQSMLTISDFPEDASKIGEVAAAYIDTTLRRQRFPSQATSIVRGRPDPLIDGLANDTRTEAEKADDIDGLPFTYHDYARSLDVASVLVLRESGRGEMEVDWNPALDPDDPNNPGTGVTDPTDLPSPSGTRSIDVAYLEASLFDLASGKRIWRGTTQVSVGRLGKRSTGRDLGRHLLAQMREDGLFPAGMRSHFSPNLSGR